METEKLSSAIEAILFAADRPVTLDRLREVFGEEGPTPEQLTEQLMRIQERLRDVASGFELRQAQGGYQFTTKIENAEVVRKFLQTKPFRLGRSALETLSIIAYRQPITRAEIDQVRGIDSSHLMRTLIERGLVKMAGKAEVPGRPVQYATTPKFLETLGLKSPADLPPLTELEQLEGDTTDPEKVLEEGLERFLNSKDTLDTAEKDEVQKGLEEIEGLLASAEGANREIYESPEEAAVAEENRLAIEALQASKPKRRSRSIKYEELTASAPPSVEVTEILEMPEVPPPVSEDKPIYN